MNKNRKHFIDLGVSENKKGVITQFRWVLQARIASYLHYIQKRVYRFIVQNKKRENE